jgi:hypothetical protein
MSLRYLENFKNCAIVNAENGGRIVKININELILRSGVSPPAAFKALDGDPVISEKTKRKVES